MIEYLYQSTLCWALFYLLYALLLRKETFFNYNRWYLLSTLLLGMIIPLIEFQIPTTSSAELSVFHPTNYLETITITGQAIETNMQEIIIHPVEENWSVQMILLTIYWIGVVFFAGRFLLGLKQILSLRLNGKKIRRAGYTLILTPKIHLPFSFFNFLFWSEKVEFNTKDAEQVMRHEQCHIREKHSFDVIFSELVSIFFWCSPFVFFYRKELKNIHEYLADSAVLVDTPTRSYGQLLLKQSQSGLIISQANNFIHSQLKNRIIMMTKTKSQRKSLLKYATLIPLLLLLVFSISARNELVELTSSKNTALLLAESDTIPPATNVLSGAGEVFQVVEEMPRFPGCEDQPEAERTKCAQMNMLKHIYSELKYPKNSRRAGTQGVAVAQFIVEKDGSITNVEIVRSVDNEIDAEVKRVVTSMPNFVPGKQRGKNVRVQFALPVKFKLEGDLPADKDKAQAEPQKKIELGNFPENVMYIVDGKEVLSIESIMPDEIISINIMKGEKAMAQYGEKARNGVVSITTTKERIHVVGYAPVDESEIRKAEHPIRSKEIFKVVETMPIFPGAATRDEGNKKMLEFIYKNLKYPATAKEKNVEGMVVVNFIVSKEGRIVDPKIVRSIGAGTDEEVLRTVNEMAKIPEAWTPGVQRGKTVNVSFNLPIKFKLDASEKKQSSASTKAEAKTETEVFELVNIFPNPTSDAINAELIVKNDLPTTVIVTDANGKQIYKEEFENNHIQINDLNLKDTGNGILLMSFFQKGKLLLTKEIAVQK